MTHRNRVNRGRAQGAQSRDQSSADAFKNALRGDGSQISKHFDPRTDRKTLQLCRQVQRSLMLAMAGECADDLLREVSIDSVAPVGGSGHFLVQVIVPHSVSVITVLTRLNERSGKLRALTAAAICRKRVPMLSFTAIAGNENQGVEHD